MREYLTKRRVMLYILYFLLACLLVLGVTYSRYKSNVTGTGSASVATVALDSTVDLSSKLKDMAPGKTSTIDFTVSNSEKDMDSEVTQEYSIMVRSTGNLPLTYSLEGDTDGSGDAALTLGGGTDADPVYRWSGGRFPFGSQSVHTYKLKVNWPADKAAGDYSEEIDQLTMVVEAKQAETN